jgi:transcriptional regulator with XRE-family HTH domain
MGRPQEPLDRDGSPVRELAFWLRNLRSHAGLTYEELGRRAHYATSTVQAAASGKRLPTLRVTLAYVDACGGNVRQWHGYWTQIRRATDPDHPAGAIAPVLPPWEQGERGVENPPDPGGTEPDAADAAVGSRDLAGEDDGWYVESFSALLHLDAAPIEAVEHRTVVATWDGVRELATSISVPRHPAEDACKPHGLETELLEGGTLELREQPYESYFRNVIALPRPLRRGDRHDYRLRLRIPPGQPMASHYVHVPFRRSDYFELRVCFDRQHLPRAVWALCGAPTAVIYELNPAKGCLQPDRFGEVQIRFRNLRLGLGYGLCWQDES